MHLTARSSSMSQAVTRRSASSAFDQGRTKWQGETLDFVWFDEEPPRDIYFEGLTPHQRDRWHGLSYLHAPEGYE